MSFCKNRAAGSPEERKTITIFGPVIVELIWNLLEAHTSDEVEGVAIDYLNTFY